MQSWRLQLFTYLSAIWQYRWQGLAAAWVVCVLGWLGVATIPNTYKSTAEVYIDTHTLLRPLLKGLAVTPNPNNQIQVMLQTLLTDPTLERVVRATDPKASSMSSSMMQDAIAHFRKNISLKNLRTKDLYSISYRDPDPAHAQAVAQTLVSSLIDTSLGGQRRDANQVGTFLDNQIANYEQKLEAADKRRAEFKTAHLDFFVSTPGGDKLSGAGDVVAAQAAVTRAQNTLNEAINRRNALQAQLKSTSKTLDVNSPLPATMDRTGTAITGRSQLAAAIARLNTLRTRYTDNYPDVVAQKRLIARLKTQQTGDSGDTQGISNPGYVMIMSKLADTESEVAADRSRLKDAQKRLETSKKMAAKAITVQREYQNLDRDYRVLHKNYETLVARRESAKITQAAGDQQSAFVFRVISPPVKPNHPDAPNRLLLNAAVLLLGIGAGGALAFGLGQFSGKFLSSEQVKETFELPVLGAITTVRTGHDMAVARVSTTLFGTGLGLLIISCLVLLFFSHSGMGAGLGPSL
jgi:polysaccharide chain length determinant protein (PEP-CTERM system associated)